MPCIAAPLVASIGLVLDIAGACWVVKAIIAGKDHELAEAADASGHYAAAEDAPPVPRVALLKMFMDSRRDAKVGLSLLVLGFVFQLVAQWL